MTSGHTTSRALKDVSERSTAVNVETAWPYPPPIRRTRVTPTQLIYRRVRYGNQQGELQAKVPITRRISRLN